MAQSYSSDTVVILNPESGDGTHADTVQKRAELQRYTVKQTNEPGDAITFAQEAAEAGVSTIAAAGGDGTVNEVVQGIERASAYEQVTLGVLPVGTGNNFAKNIGVSGLDSGFDVLEDGRHRWIDVGYAGDRPFLNSCIAGLTAESSSETSPEMKKRLGVLAYVLSTLRSLSDFDGLRLSVDIDGGRSEKLGWAGDAIFVLVGNGRRFTTSGSNQANMEDGLFDVTIIEEVSALDLMSEALVEQLLGPPADHLLSTQTSALTITIHNPGATRFSLDGEISSQRRLELKVRPRTLTIAVGDSYEPHPE